MIGNDNAKNVYTINIFLFFYKKMSSLKSITCMTIDNRRRKIFTFYVMRGVSPLVII